MRLITFLHIEKLALEVEEMKREIENFAQTKHEMEEMTVALQKDVASKRQEALAMIERVTVYAVFCETLRLTCIGVCCTLIKLLTASGC